MPDLTTIIQTSTTHLWLYLPIAVVLGALHALEPGHAKSLMAAYIVAIRGTTKQAVVLATSAAVGHTIVVWLLAIAALAFGQRYIVDQAEPWLKVISGILIVLLALPMFWVLGGRHRHDHSHHHHDHDHGHGHAHHGHSHEAPMIRGGVTTGQIIWFGFTGGLMPCPAAIAVLLICVQIKAFALGIAMVAAFSVGIGLTLIAIGLTVVWGASKISKAWPSFDRAAQKLPYLSAALVFVAGVLMTAAGLNAAGLLASRKPN
jgi:nickel/cobalt transporter (NicO) family protein